MSAFGFYRLEILIVGAVTVMGILLLGLILRGDTDKQTETLTANQRHIQQMLLQNRDSIERNSEQIDLLLNQASKGPRHTACDTVQILAELRKKGIDLPHFMVEDRCEKKAAEAAQ